MKVDEQRISKAKNLGAKYQITIEEDGKVLFLKEPEKTHFKMWFDLKEDTLASNESLIRSLVIPQVSDMDVLENMKSLGGAFAQIGEIMALKKSTLVTL